MLIEQGQLLRLRRRFEDHASAVRNAVHGAQPRDLAHGLLAKHGRKIGAVEVSLLVSRHELGPVPVQYGHEVLARPVLEVQHAGPQSRGACGSRRLDYALGPMWAGWEGVPNEGASLPDTRDRAAVAIVGGPIGAQLERAHIAEGAAVLASRVWIQGPREPHVLDRVQGGLALDFDVFDLRQARLHSGHPYHDRTNVLCD